MAEISNFKSTLNLPKTDFPMKGNLPVREPEIVQKWQSTGVYKAMMEKNTGKTKFVMPDGPIYSNGDIHVGHALNKVLKDIIIKYKNMQGFYAAFVPGWDCHGLPIELKVTKKLGSRRKELTDEKIRDLCRQEAQKWVERQMNQFVRLGVLADWENPYLTLSPDYEAEEIRVLARIFDNGILYHGEKPVYWCPALQTALAAAEVEYHDHKSLSVFVKFEVESGLEKIENPKNKTSFVIWTTTPWTLPANYGIALNKNFDYGLYQLSWKDSKNSQTTNQTTSQTTSQTNQTNQTTSQTRHENILIACDLKESVEKACDVTLTEVQRFKGSQLEGMTAKHPFIQRSSQVILGDHVTLEAGTGCVHTAPGHGMDDYYVAQKYKLPIHSPVDKAGRYTSEVPEYQGEKIWEANPKIAQALKQSGHLLGMSDLIHSYPHNPRTKTPLIFRATPQWFIRMDDEKYHLRNKALVISKDQMAFIPQWGYQRLYSMLSQSPDWCISRQRIWGVPLPVFYCNHCNTPLAHSEIMNRVADKMESTGQGMEAFYSTSPDEFTRGHRCSKCQGEQFSQSRDILDVWFDSGVCHSAVQKKREELSFPADIYLEGSDQHRGWFQTSLISSLAAYDAPPFKALITHGFVNDSQGNKMSKSRGNVIDPAEVIKKNGAEILRLWTAYEDYGQDVNVSHEMFQRITETYRRIRNTMRFLLGNIADFDLQKDSVEFANMPPLEQWALIKLNHLIEKITAAYDSYDYYKVYHAVNHFYTVDLSATYLDILKDRLYTWKKEAPDRRSSQTVLYHLLTNLNTMMAPILSFLSEEIHEYLPEPKAPSVFLEDFPRTKESWRNESLQKQMDQVMNVRVVVSQTLEPMRKNKEIGSSLDAMVTLYAPTSTLKTLKTLQNSGGATQSMSHHTSSPMESHTGQGPDYLKEILIVSKVELKKAPELRVEAQVAPGEKCPRCWHYTTEPRTIGEYSGVCPKCVEALK